MRGYGKALLAACGFMLAMGPAGARAEIIISPNRIVLENAQTAATIVAASVSTRERTLRIGWYDVRMDEDGDLTEVDQASAVPGIRPFTVYSPRQSKLGPSESQVVRILLRPPTDLPDGEYRTHIRVQIEPDVLPETTNGGGDIRFALQAVFGIAVPVIYRKGRLDVVGGIRDLSVRRSRYGAKASFVLTRSGKHSAIGDVVVTLNGQEIARIDSMPLYAEIERRHVEMELTKPGGGRFDPGEIVVSFSPEGSQPARTSARLD
jgi:hypothetical protein